MKKNGFTLIELLAVIVILAIIVVIAVPQILSVIEDSKKGAFESDAKLLLNALDNQKLVDEDFDVTTIDQNSILDLGISNANYQTLKLSIYESKPYVLIVGKNKWNGLKACGNMKNIKVVESSNTICSNLPTTIVSIHPQVVSNTCNPDNMVASCLSEIKLFPSSFTPAGYLKCDGSLVSTSSYSNLFSLINTTYGGDGTTNFGVPNLSAPVAGLSYYISTSGNTPDWTGTSPTTNGGNNYFSYQSSFENYLVGEIRLATSVAAGNTMMLPCDGRLLNISSYPALFSVIGGVFGGDARSNFGLPNLSSVTPPINGASYYMVVKGAMPQH